MDDHLRQEANAFFQKRLGLRSIVLASDYTDAQAEDFLRECSAASDSRDVWNTIVRLRAAVGNRNMLVMPLGENDHLVAAGLADDMQTVAAICLSIQTGTSQLARCAVESVCEAWSLSLQLVDSHAMQLNARSPRHDAPHSLQAPHGLQGNLSLNTLLALFRAMQSRDRYTQEHSVRVAELAFELARRLGLAEDVGQEIYWTGLLHDIGKIGIPDAILLKENALSEDEADVMQRHPEIGYRIVDGIEELQFALPGILHHHERWDGCGYPHGLVGASTPLMARILAVADSFDAMTSSRVYRKAMSRQTAVTILTEGGGRQWDEMVTECFAKWMAQRPAGEEGHPAERALQMLSKSTLPGLVS